MESDLQRVFDYVYVGTLVYNPLVQRSGEDEDRGARSSRAVSGTPQDLVEVVDRLEAQEDEADQELNSGMMPNGSRDLDEVRHHEILTL